MSLESILSVCTNSIDEVRDIYEVYLPYRVCWNKMTKEVYFYNRLYKPLGMEEGKFDDPPLTSKQINVAYMFDDRMYEMNDNYLRCTILSIEKMLRSMIEKGYIIRDDFIQRE